MKIRSFTRTLATFTVSLFTLALLANVAPAVTITEDFQGVTVPAIPTGWAVVGSGVTTSANGNPGNALDVGGGGSAGYLVNSSLNFDTTTDFSGSFDFYLNSDEFYDNLSFYVGDVTSGLTTNSGDHFRVDLKRATFSRRASIYDATGNTDADKLFNGDNNNNYSISASKWYTADFNWTAATGDFSFSWDDGSTSKGPMTLSGHSFNTLGVNFGFGTLNDVGFFDNISLDGTLYTEYVWDGGDGNWSTVAGNENWNSPSSVVWSAGENAHFNAGTGTITITDANVTTGAIIFDGTYTVQDNSGGETLTANGPIFANAASEISAEITGSGGLTKSGSAILTLSGTNTYTGGTNVSAGTLLVTGTLANQGVDGTTIASGATLQIGNGSTTGAIGTEAIDNSGTLIINRSDNPPISNNIAGAGALTASNSATLTGTNNIGGATTVSSGTLVFSGTNANTLGGTISGNIQQSSSGALSLNGDNSGQTAAVTVDATRTLNVGGNLGANVSVTNNGTINFNTASTVAVAGDISGTGGLNQSAAGTTTLSGNNSYSGATSVSDGELILSGSGDINDSTTIGVSGTGKLTYSSDVGLTKKVTVTGAAASMEIGGGSTVADIDLDTGATLDAGNLSSAGAISVDGGTIELGDGVIATLTAGGTGLTVGLGGAALNWNHGADGVGDQIAGDLNISGGLLTINVFGLESVPTGGTWTVFTGTVTGDIANVFVNGVGDWRVSKGGSLILTLIPEPSTIILAGLGLLGLTFRRRHR